MAGGKWWLRFRTPPDEDGKRRQRSVLVGEVKSFSSFDDVRSEADRIIDHHAPRRLLPGASLEWVAWCAIFDREFLSMLRASSQATLRSILRNHVDPAFAHLKTHELTVPVIQEWVNAQMRQGVERNTLLARYSLLRLMLRRAAAAGVAAVAPPPRAIVLRDRQGEFPLPSELGYSQEEVRRMLEACVPPAFPAWFFLLVLMLGRCGLRVGEALALRGEHVDLERRLILVRQSVARGAISATKTRSSRRDVPMSEDVFEVLSRSVVIEPNAFLFAGRDGKPRTASSIRRHQLLPLLAAAGVKPRSFHAFRHALASAMLAAGANAAAVRDVLGHVSIVQTDEYVDATLHERRAAIEAARLGGMRSHPIGG